jgi:hypothetical protein
MDDFFKPQRSPDGRWPAGGNSATVSLVCIKKTPIHAPMVLFDFAMTHHIP